MAAAMGARTNRPGHDRAKASSNAAAVINGGNHRLPDVSNFAQPSPQHWSFMGRRALCSGVRFVLIRCGSRQTRMAGSRGWPTVRSRNGWFSSYEGRVMESSNYPERPRRQRSGRSPTASRSETSTTRARSRKRLWTRSAIRCLSSTGACASSPPTALSIRRSS